MSSLASIDRVLSSKSAWKADAAYSFLSNSRLPLRISSLDRKGFPHITSLWFRFRQGRFWCCTQQQSVVCRNVHRDSRVGFEVAVNEPPYHGASGTGTARIFEGDGEDTEALLNELMDQYLGDRDPTLKAWLLSRVATEAIIELIPTHLTSWDFRNRMTAAG